MPLLTKAQFKQKRPGGVYANYLKYVANNGSPAMRKAAKQALAQQTGKNAPSGAFTGANPAHTMLEQAQAQAQAGIQPQQQEIERQQQIQKDLAAAQAKATQGYSNAANTILQGVAPQITQAYQAAAGAQAGLAQGFAGGLRDTANAEAAQQAAILAKQGAPAEQIQQVQGQTGDAGAGDVLYGTQGYIPGTSLGAQGAAYAAQAAGLPAVNVAYTRDALANQAYQAQQTQKELSQRIADLQAQLPGLTSQALVEIQQRQRDKVTLQIALKELGLKESDMEWQHAMDVFDQETTASELAIKKGAMDAIDPSQSAAAGILVNGYGQPILDKNGNTQPYVGSSSSDVRTPGELIAKARSAFLTTLRDDLKEIGIFNPEVRGKAGTLNAGKVVKPQTPKVYWKARKAVYTYLRPEIDAMLAAGVSQTEIDGMVRDFLAQQGIKPPYKKPPGP